MGIRVIAAGIEFLPKKHSPIDITFKVKAISYQHEYEVIQKSQRSEITYRLEQIGNIWNVTVNDQELEIPIPNSGRDMFSLGLKEAGSFLGTQLSLATTIISAVICIGKLLGFMKREQLWKDGITAMVAFYAFKKFKAQSKVNVFHVVNRLITVVNCAEKRNTNPQSPVVLLLEPSDYL